jgi:membrane protein implicated in regulation of membrane protease activity
MVGKIFALLLGLALFNFAVFTVCFFWSEISMVVITPHAMFLALLPVVCLAIPLAIMRYVEYRKKEDDRRNDRKQRLRQKVEAVQQKEIGIDF